MSALRILLLEDDPSDAELVQATLEADQIVCDVNVVKTQADFLTGLANDQINLVLADYKLPSFDGLSALKLSRSIRPDLPFIFVSGTFGEEAAIEALKIGATDYVLKTRLSKLVPAVRRALREREERQKAEDAQRRSEEELRDVIETIPTAAWTAGPDGQVEFVNRQWREYSGLSAAQSAGSGWQAAVHPDDLDRHLDRWLTSLSTGTGFEGEVRYRRASDSQYRWFMVRAVPLRDGQGKVLKWYGISTDVDDRKRAEQTLREQTRLLDLTHDAIFVWDMNRVIRYWNRGAEQLYGWTAEQVIGKPGAEILKTIFPAPFERIKEELLSAGRWEGELVRTKSDGTQVSVAGRWSLQRDAGGMPIATLETNNDITDRKRADEERERLRQVEEDLARISRVSMMAELTGSLAHELKQPIAAAVMNVAICLRWLERDPPDAKAAHKVVSRIVNDLNRAADIVDRNHALYRRGTSQRESIDLNEIVQEIVALTRGAAFRHAISIRTELDRTLPATTGDRVQVQQVLMNLILNAIDAMKSGGGELRVASSKSENDLLISVIDSGIGLPAEGKGRIFEAFFTTKPQGTGMGLSLSRRIVESHGGRLWAQANPERGATFHFTLPVTASESLPRPLSSSRV
jgi:PAS domain S-box-containing protein